MRCALTIILHCICIFCFAQKASYHFDIYNTRNGLSDNSINAIIKDNRDFMWIGTAEGLNRFDGNRFINFFSNNNDPATLSGNTIFDILQYKPGQLLIGTNNGLSVFNTISNSFENDRIKIKELQKGSGTYIRSVFKDRQKNIYITHSGVIDVFNDTLQFKYRLTDLPWAHSLRGVIINKKSCYEDVTGQIWLPTDNRGLCIIDQKNKQVYTSDNNPHQYPFIVDRAIRGFLFDEVNQVIYFARWGFGLQKYDLKKNLLQHQLFGLAIGNEASCINSITMEKNGSLICGGGQAIYRVDPLTLDYKIINEAFNINSLPAFLGSCILNDSSYIWIGTETKGLLKLPARESLVQQLSLPYELVDYTNFCRGTLRSENGLLYMAYGLDGLIESDTRTFAINNYRLHDAHGLPINISRISEDHLGRLWIGTTAGIYFFDKKTKHFSKANILPAAIQNLDIVYLFCDSNGNMWVASTGPNSLGFYNASRNQFSFYENYRIDNRSFFDSASRIFRMIEDQQQNIWIISYDKGGIACFNATNKNWDLFPKTSTNITLLADRELNAVYPIGGNSLLLSNDESLGLAKYNYKTEAISFVTRKDGLVSDNITAITKGKDNELYLVSKAGINLYNPATNKIRTLRFSDENINLSFAYQQFYDSANGQLIYGLNDRILFIKDDIWKPVQNEQVTFIDNISVNNSVVPLDRDSKKMRLNYDERNVTINFASVSYTENTLLSYAHKLEGVDKDWVITADNPTANYANLSPGSYSFLVKTKNQTGEWGPVNDSLQLVIAPPFWQTWWFIGGLITVAGILVYLIFRRRITAIRHESEMKHKIGETEMMALRAQMNPHFIFNCLNSIDNLIQTDQKEKATDYLAKFAQLIRAILENSKSNTIPCWKDLEALKLYLQMEELRWDKKITCHISIANEIQNGDYKVPPMVIQPFVENAIHHGLLNKVLPNKKLDIEVHLEANAIKYTITDNGVGRSKAAEYKKLNRATQASFGLQITKDRIDLFNQNTNGSVKITDLMDEKHQPSGTKVEVWLTTQPITT